MYVLSSSFSSSWNFPYTLFVQHYLPAFFSYVLTSQFAFLPFFPPLLPFSADYFSFRLLSLPVLFTNLLHYEVFHEAVRIRPVGLISKHWFHHIIFLWYHKSNIIHDSFRFQNKFLNCCWNYFQCRYDLLTLA